MLNTASGGDPPKKLQISNVYIEGDLLGVDPTLFCSDEGAEFEFDNIFVLD